MEPEDLLPRFKKARHMSLSWARSIQSMTPSPVLNIHLNIILPSTPGSYKWHHTLRFPYQNPVYNSPAHILATCPANIILFDLITRIIFGEVYRSLSSSLCSFLHSTGTSSLLGPHILLSTLFSNTLSLPSSFNCISVYLNYLYFEIENWKAEDSEPNDKKHSLNSICSEFLPD